MNKRLIAAVATTVLAVLGIVSLIVYANGARDRAFEGAELVQTLQVVQDIPAGASTDVVGESVESVKLPRAAVPDSAIASLEAVSGKVTKASLVKGEFLLASRFGAPGDVAEGGHVSVPKGMQEVAISLPAVRVVGGTISAGETVGIAVSYDSVAATNFALNKVLVTGIGAAPTKDGVVTGDVLVRVALNTEDSTKLVHAAEYGKIYLTRQNKDAEVGRDVIDTNDVLK